LNDLERKKREILDRVDLVQVVSEHVTLKRSGRRWVGLCCFHSEKTPSFSVNPELGIFKCFGCGKGGDVLTFVQLRENVSFMEALRILADRAGVRWEDERTPKRADGISRSDVAEANAWAVRYFQSQLRHPETGKFARNYLDGRRISPAMVEKFGLGLASDGPGRIVDAAASAGHSAALVLEADLVRRGDDGRVYDTFRGRLMFPIRDATGRVVGFGGRTLGDHPAKYINTRQNMLFDKGRGLYGLDQARGRMTETGRAILVEGYTDCIAAHQAGFAETVATLGTALTEAQVRLLRRYVEKLILLFDSDHAGEAAADRAIELALPNGLDVRLARISEGKDPSDFLSLRGPEAFLDVLNGSVPALEFKWFQTLLRFDGNGSGAGRGEAVREFIRVVAAAWRAGAVDPIQRGLAVNQVAHLLKMDRTEVADFMRRSAPTAKEVNGSVQRLPASPETKERTQERTAWSHLLGAVLNEPAVLFETENWPKPDHALDAQDRRLAEIVLDTAAQLGEFRLADVLARCHEPEDVERVAFFADGGARRGNHKATFAGALDRIRRARRTRELDDKRRELVDKLAGGKDGHETQTDLQLLSEGLKEHRHYAPRRLIRRAAAVPVPPSPAPRE
jgi:DNA primase